MSRYNVHTVTSSEITFFERITSLSQSLPQNESVISLYRKGQLPQFLALTHSLQETGLSVLLQYNLC